MQTVQKVSLTNRFAKYITTLLLTKYFDNEVSK